MLLMLCAGQKTIAQPSDVTDPVNVSIDLTAAVISIDLGTDPDVAFVYADAEDYANEQTETMLGHFTVVSNQPYEIAVAANTEFTSPSSDEVPLSIVDVSVDPGTANGGTLATIPLSTTPGILVTGADPSTGAVYNVDYTIADAAPLVGLSAEVYTTSVTYTATHL